jgi:hypothetical protein
LSVEGISIREFAKREGCDDKVVRRKIKSRHLPTLADGKVDPSLVGSAWRLQQVGASPVRTSARADSVRDLSAPNETPQQAADRIVNHEGRAPYTKVEAERIKENYLALLRQLEYDRESGAVVAVEDVAMAVASEYAIVRTNILGIPAKLAPRLAILRSAEEVKALLEAEITRTLEDLTRDGGGGHPAGP